MQYAKNRGAVFWNIWRQIRHIGRRLSALPDDDPITEADAAAISRAREEFARGQLCRTTKLCGNSACDDVIWPDSARAGLRAINREAGASESPTHRSDFRRSAVYGDLIVEWHGERTRHGWSIRFSRAVTAGATGIALGFEGVAILARLLTRILFQIPPLDPATFALEGGRGRHPACLIPASRATLLDPVAELRKRSL